MVKFVAAIYGIMECHPVTNDFDFFDVCLESKHTIGSYISFCDNLYFEDEQIQKQKIIQMTDKVLKDLATSWETVCDCYRKLKQ